MPPRVHNKRRKKIGSIAITIGVIVILFLLFVVSVAWFRTSKPEPEQPLVDSIADVLTPESIAESVIEGGIDTLSKTANLYHLTSDAPVGVTVRGTKDEKFYIEMKTTLPEIDREVSFYEVWLVRQVPFHFISTGEMLTNEEGEFVLEWTAEEEGDDYSDYTQVVVTIESREDYAGPGPHVAEGEFGE
jgi:hypothetical protein